MAEFNYTEYLKNNPLLQEEVKDKLLTESQEVSEKEIYENVLAQKLRDEAKHPDSKIGAAIFNKYAEKVEKANKEDYVKLLKDMESELISKHPDTFSGEDDIPGSFLSEEVPSSKTTVSALKAQIKEMILASLLEEEPVAEADEDEEVEVDIEDEIEADAEPEMEPAMDAAPEGGAEGLSSDEKEIQDALKLAYDNAISIGDQKLADQIGNSITFFTRTHVVER
jgi:hypothetical protein